MQFPTDKNRRQDRPLDDLPTFEECRLLLAILEETIEAGDYEVFWASYRSLEPTAKLLTECCIDYEMSVPTVAFLFGLDSSMIIDILMLEWLIAGMGEPQPEKVVSIACYLSKDKLARKRAVRNATLKMILESAA
ncbi:MAG: hypothetical protein KF784_10440 [Fimbriimonadaceae bacterium]|nr:hypothetical protein [Fimbriimonadaceae bacterium]